MTLCLKIRNSGDSASSKQKMRRKIWKNKSKVKLARSGQTSRIEFIVCYLRACENYRNLRSKAGTREKMLIEL